MVVGKKGEGDGSRVRETVKEEEERENDIVKKDGRRDFGVVLRA